MSEDFWNADNLEIISSDFFEASFLKNGIIVTWPLECTSLIFELVDQF